MSAGPVIYYNNILGHDATALFSALRDATGTATITEFDVPFYFFGDKTPSVADWRPVSLQSISGDADQELLFLADFGLAMQVGDTDEYLVSPKAVTLFYGDTGLFNTNLTDEQREAAQEAFYEFMRDTVLPGYLRMCESVAAGLSPAIQLKGEAEARISQIQDVLALLKGHA